MDGILFYTGILFGFYIGKYIFVTKNQEIIKNNPTHNEKNNPYKII